MWHAKNYLALWLSFIACMAEREKMMKSLAEKAEGFFPNQENYLKVFSFSDYDHQKIFQSKAEEIFQRIIWQAERDFAPPGVTRVDIDESPLRDRYFTPIIDNQTWSDFNPVSLYQAI
jgi:hypothetical protein